MPTNDELTFRFAHHPPRDNTTIEAHQKVRESFTALSHIVNDLLPEGREKACAITHLEEAAMWSNASIARNGDK